MATLMPADCTCWGRRIWCREGLGNVPPPLPLHTHTHPPPRRLCNQTKQDLRSKRQEAKAGPYSPSLPHSASSWPHQQRLCTGLKKEGKLQDPPVHISQSTCLKANREPQGYSRKGRGKGLCGLQLVHSLGKFHLCSYLLGKLCMAYQHLPSKTFKALCQRRDFGVPLLSHKATISLLVPWSHRGVQPHLSLSHIHRTIYL